MTGGLVLETSFLIDHEREVVRDRPGPAHAFLAEHAAAPLHITFTTAGELAAGFGPRGRDAWEGWLGALKILACSLDVSWEYSRIYRYLKSNGRLIGTNNLWIGATALVAGLPLVTRDTEHFGRIPGLEVLTHATGPES